MSPLTSTIIVTTPADAVWEIVAHRFDRIGDCATAIPSSTATTAPPIAGAPVAGRVCHTGLRPAPEVTETVVAYDDTDRTLTYEATASMPAFVTTARNQWRITALDSHRTQVTFTAQVKVRWVLGRLAWWMLLFQIRYAGRHLLADLKHYVETAHHHHANNSRPGHPGVHDRACDAHRGWYSTLRENVISECRPAPVSHRRRPKQPVLAICACQPFAIKALTSPLPVHRVRPCRSPGGDVAVDR